MKERILLIGLGTSGCNVIKNYISKHENDDSIKAMFFDNAEFLPEEVPACAKAFSLNSNLTAGEVIETLGEENVKYYFPYDSEVQNTKFLSQVRMNVSSSGFRAKGILSLSYFLSQHRDELVNYLKSTLLNEEEATYKFYVVSSLCGGFGSSLILPLTFFIKKVFKENFNKPISGDALLILPDVYTSLIDEVDFKTKLYANAYATMSEINSVNVAIKNFGLDKVDEIDSPRFVIGSKNDPYLGLLFDSQDKEFLSKCSYPFTNVYFFNKLPAENDITLNERFVSDALYSLAKKYFVNTDSDHIYSLVSFSEVNFALDTVVDYSSKKYVSDVVSQSYKDISDDLQKYLVDQQRIAAESNQKFNPSGDLANVIVEYVEQKRTNYALETEKKYDSFANYLLNRKEAGESYNVDSEDLIDSYCRTLIISITDKLNKDHNVSDFASLYDFKAMKKIKKVHKGDKKSNKYQTKVDELKERVKGYFEILNKSYQDLLSEFVTAKQSVSETLLGSGETSIIDLCFKDDDEFIHPFISLYRLSQLHLALKGHLRNLRINDAEYSYLTNGGEHNIYSKFLFFAEDGFDKKSEYSQCGEERFARYVIKNFDCDFYSGNTSILFKSHINVDLTAPNYDDFFFANDCIKCYKQLLSNFAGLYVKAIDEFVCELISKLSDMFTDVGKYTRKLEALVIESYNRGSKSNRFFNFVGSGYKEKDEAYSGLIDHLDDKNIRFKMVDSAIGEELSKLIVNSENNQEFVAILMKNMLKKAANEFISSSFYDKLNKQNILEILNKALANDDKLIYNFHTFMPIRIEEKDNSKVFIQPKMFLPESVIAFAREQNKSIMAIDNNEFINEYLNRLGINDFAAEIRGDLDKHSIYFGQITQGFDLSSVPFFNESGKDSWFKQYNNALYNSAFFKSEIWFPHAFKSDYSCYLNLISEDAQNKEKRLMVKAFMHLLNENALQAINFEDDDQDYAALMIKGELTALKLGDSYIKYNDYESIFKYLLTDKVNAYAFAHKYDEKVSFIKSNMPSIVLDKTNEEQGSYFARVMSKLDLTENDTYVLNKKKIHSWIYFAFTLKDENNAFVSNLAKEIAKTYFDTLIEISSPACQSNFFDEIKAFAIESAMNKMSRYEEYKEIKEWVNRNDLHPFAYFNE